MPEYLTPGIYLRPKPEAKRDVRLVRTDVAGFVGYAERGQLVYPGIPDEVAKRLPLRITSWKEFRAVFGGLIPNGHLAYAVKGFFENGGMTAYVVRAAATHAQAIEQRPREATLLFPAGSVGAPLGRGLRFTARSKGGWGNRIRVVITPLEVTPEAGGSGGHFTSFSLRIAVDRGPDTSAPVEEEYYNRLSLASDPKDPEYAFNVIERVNRFSNLVQVSASGSVFFVDPELFGMPRNLEGGQDGLTAITARDITGGEDDLRGLRLLEEIDDIGILCVPDAVFAYQAPKAPPPPSEDPCRPKIAEPPANPSASDPTALPSALDPKTIYVGMIEQCERLRDRVAIIDTPRTVRGAGPLLTWRNQFATRFAALYYPWIEVPDALNALGGTRQVPPSGHVSGIYAYTDNAFGVQRPPANAELDFITGVADDIDAHAQENLNPFNINAIRGFPGRGIRVWGARSLASASDSDWRFIHARRLMSMIEKSVEKSMQWTVFEPNDFSLRRTLTHSLNVFLETIWRDGGLKGREPAAGFFVRCDETNNPQSVIDAGQLVCQVGIAVAAPMEFLVFEIRQGGGQTEVLEQ